MFSCFNYLCGFGISMNNIHPDIQNSNWNSVEPFQPDVHFGKVIKVYDGDSITIVAKPYENYPAYRFSVRLNGIDTPELRTHDENEKKHGYIARDALSAKILNKIVVLKNVGSEKYGRLLADIYFDDENICEWMVIQGYAVRYDGGTKVKPKEWLE
jgi:micrococcal nuclease|tara:strand:- start:325 stop:792 length:468 start_codon:yes stop_codon:yes gene_type:complete